MRSALDHVSDQEQGNQSDCEYAANQFHVESLAWGGKSYNCPPFSQICQHPHRHTNHHQVLREGDEPKRYLAVTANAGAF